MKAIVFDDFGSADVLRLADVPAPEVRPDDLLVKVMAAGVNRADLLHVKASMALRLTATVTSSASRSPEK